MGASATGVWGEPGSGTGILGEPGASATGADLQSLTLPGSPRSRQRSVHLFFHALDVLDHFATGLGALLACLGTGLHLGILLVLVARLGTLIAGLGAGITHQQRKGASASRDLGSGAAQLSAIVAQDHGQRMSLLALGNVHRTVPETRVTTQSTFGTLDGTPRDRVLLLLFRRLFLLSRRQRTSHDGQRQKYQNQPHGRHSRHDSSPWCKTRNPDRPHLFLADQDECCEQKPDQLILFAIQRRANAGAERNSGPERVRGVLPISHSYSGYRDVLR